MSRTLTLKNGVSITVNSTCFASGGEGDLHKIIAPSSFKNQVVKIYKPNKQTKEREHKVEYLVANPPSIQSQNGHYPIIWTNQSVYENGKFVGFTMHEAKGENLELLCGLNLPPKLGSNWSHFDFQNPQALQNRKKLCFNIAAAVFQIHSLGNYVLVDMKPENIIVQANGLISIIDIDSIQVIKNNNVLYPAAVATPDYIPVEYYKGIKPGKALIPETWDRFSLGVMFYRLMSGIHPFVGTCRSPFDGITDVSGKIERGLYPNGANQDKFQMIPPPHSIIRKLDRSIQIFFQDCFDKGHISPKLRPSANDWCHILSPTSIIKVNRLLPSQEYCYLNFEFSIPRNNYFTFSPKLKDCNLLNLNKSTGIKRIWGKLTGASKLESLVEEIIKKESKWIVIQLEAEHKIKAFRQLKNEFYDELNNIYQEFYRIIQTKKQDYIASFRLLDQEGKQLILKEEQELSMLEKKKLNNSSNYDIKLRQYYATFIEPIEQQFKIKGNKLHQLKQELIANESAKIKQATETIKNQIKAIKKEITVLENKYISNQDVLLNDILEQINEKRKNLKARENKALFNKLEDYQGNFIANHAQNHKIKHDARNIFIDPYASPKNLALALANHNIRTAADFTAIDSSGSILTKNGEWVKVRGIAGYRAKCLEKWRKSKIRDIPTSIPQALPYSEKVKILKNIQTEYSKLDEKERNARRDALKRKSNVPQSLIEKKILTDKKERALYVQLNDKTNSININFTVGRQSVENEYNKLKIHHRSVIAIEQQKFEQQKVKIAKEQQRIILLYQEEKKRIRDNYNALHNQLMKKAKNIGTIAKNDLDNLKTAFNHRINTNLNKFMSKYQSMGNSWERFQQKASIYITELNLLHQAYRKLIS